MSNFPQETPQSFFPIPEASAAPIFTRLPSFLKILEKKPSFLGMAKISIPSFALPEMNPK